MSADPSFSFFSELPCYPLTHGSPDPSTTRPDALSGAGHDTTAIHKPIWCCLTRPVVADEGSSHWHHRQCTDLGFPARTIRARLSREARCSDYDCSPRPYTDSNPQKCFYVAIADNRQKVGNGRSAAVRLYLSCCSYWRSLGDSNPCFRRERAKLVSLRSK